MADINIKQAHTMSLPQAKQAAQAVADQMVAEFDMHTHWQGEQMSFSRDGVEGSLTLHAQDAQLEVTLGMLFKPMASMIEEKLTRKMARAFTASA